MKNALIIAFLLVSLPSLTYEQSPPRYINTYKALISEYHFRESHIHNLWKTESTTTDTAYGDDGKSIGRCQVQLSTALDYNPNATEERLLNGFYNTHIALKHLNWLRSKWTRKGYKGNKLLLLTFTSYNMGFARADSLLQSGRNPISSYARRIIK